MANIIAGIFETQGATDRVISELQAQGFSKDDLTSFYLNPPGQHATYPIGGDAHHDEGTKHAGRTAATGAAVGGVTGLALGSAVAAATDSGLGAMAAIAGAGVGAYVGSLAGGLTGTQQGEVNKASTEEPVERNAGYVVAVRVDGNADKAIETLRSHGAHAIERASGVWLPGAKPAWTDFDPLKPAQRV